jgi:hypothetical protein
LVATFRKIYALARPPNHPWILRKKNVKKLSNYLFYYLYKKISYVTFCVKVDSGFCKNERIEFALTLDIQNNRACAIEVLAIDEVSLLF